MRATCWLFFVVAFAASASQAQELTIQEARGFDRDQDGKLDYSELVELCLAEQGPAFLVFTPARRLEIAEDRAADLVTAFEQVLPTPGQVVTLFPQTAGTSPPILQEPKRRPRFALVRSVTDSVDPRQGKTDGPVVFSFKQDDEAEKNDKERNQYTLLGGIQIYKRTWATGPHRFVTLAPGVDLDASGSDPAEKTTIAAGVPVALDWTGTIGRGIISGTTLTFAPKFYTDRDFDREVYEAGLNLSISSEVLGSGYYRYFGEPLPTSGRPPFRFTWLPTIGVTLGRVNDANENAILQPLDGETYSRAKAGVKATLRSNNPNLPVTFQVNLQRVYDLEEELEHGYCEASVQHDLMSKAVQLTLIYRLGRKEPDFTAKDELLFGLGVTFPPKQ